MLFVIEMKKIILIAVALLTAFSASAVETADAFLGRVAAKLKSSPSIVASYRLTTDGASQRGTLTVAGNCFTIDAPGLRSWYDGKTQWTYSSQTGEVNITEPSPEEVEQINPFAVINAFRQGYKSQFVPAAAGLKKIKMTSSVPGNDISNVLFTVSDKTLDPAEIVLTLSSNQVIVIRIDSVKAGVKMPASSFRFDKSKFPGVEVVDLR